MFTWRRSTMWRWRAGTWPCRISIRCCIPGQGTVLVECARVSFWLKARLGKAGLECFAKVSGSKGLQIYVPLNTAVTYAQTRAAAQDMARVMQREHPELVIAEMAKERRRN